jgi:hypothetical protein
VELLDFTGQFVVALVLTTALLLFYKHNNRD